MSFRIRHLLILPTRHCIAVWLSAAIGIALGLSSACSDAETNPDAAPPDSAVILTIGDICRRLTDVTCRRDAECFDFFESPCEDSYFQYCCVDDGICDLVNGVVLGEVDECIRALERATCDEIETDFPEPCAGITSRDGLIPPIRHAGYWAEFRRVFR